MTLQMFTKISKKTRFATPLAASLLLLGAMQSTALAHPMFTDDAGTQGAGNNQLEINSDRVTERGERPETVGDVTYTYGLTPTLDLFADQPLNISGPRGIGDTSLGFKWRFFERGNNSIAFKSSVSMANANNEKGFGSGRNNLSTLLIFSHVNGPWALHYNLGLGTNRFKSQETEDENQPTIWTTSVAATYELLPQLKVVGDIGIARNADVNDRQYPAYALTGLVYSPSKTFDLDVGIKYGLNNASIKHQFGAGVALHF
jgi:hypothetical protein